MKRSRQFGKEVATICLFYGISWLFSLCFLGFSAKFNLLNNDGLQMLIAGIICSLVAYYLLFSRLWQKGAHDANLVAYGHVKRNYAAGVFAALFSICPHIVLLIFSVSLQNPPALLEILLHLLFLPFLSLVTLPGHIFAGRAAVLLLYLLFAFLGYYTGHKGIVILPKSVFYKKEK